MFVLCGISKSSTLQHQLSCGFAFVSCKSSWRKAAVHQNEGLPLLTEWKHQDSGQMNRKAKRCLLSEKAKHAQRVSGLLDYCAWKESKYISDKASENDEDVEENKAS